MKNRSQSDSRRGGVLLPAAGGMRSDLARLFADAVALHQAGRLMEAEPLYREVLRVQPRHFDSLHLLGVIHCQRGEMQDAVRQIDAALKINPKVAIAHNNRANALQALGQRQEAIKSYGRAIALKPDYAEAYYNRANALRESDRFSESITDYDRAVSLRPDYAEAYNNRGSALKGLEKFELALASFDRAVALRPDYAEAWYNRSNALHELARYQEALETCDKAIALNPSLAEAFNNRGNALRELRRFEEAINNYRQAVALRSDYADALNNLGNTYKDLRQYEEALDAYTRTLAIQPDHADAHHNRGMTLVEMGRGPEAIDDFDRAIELNPRHAKAHFLRGPLLYGLQRYEEAIASLKRAVELEPDLDHAKGLYLNVKMLLCDWTGFESLSAELKSAERERSGVSYPFQLLICGSTAAEQLACARYLITKRYPAFPQPLWNGERYEHRRIRIAYVSSDLRDHPVSYLAAGLFSRHDRSRFETFAISSGVEEATPVRERMKGLFEHFIDVDRMNDREAAELMRRLEIDIAVDLNGFTDGARLNLFARRPAPVQVNYLGFAGTLGQDYCDYIVADRFVIPEDARQHFQEKVVYLPNSFMVNDADRPVSAHTPSRKEAGLPDSGFVFCCFNNTFKITPNLFDVWMRLLRDVDGSVLWLSSSNPFVVANLRREAAARGVDPDRLIFATRVPSNADHLARHRLADLFLDTLYYNAHTTAADALWAGLPVLTCAGETFASRVAGSLLTNIGLPELITASLTDYEALAQALARDPERLAGLRARLARNRDVYPLFDTDRFTRHMESAFTAMWERTQRGEPPASFAVTASEQGPEHASAS
jgi:protein O-GlcNAc transferase